MSNLIDRDAYRAKMLEAMEDGYLDADTVETMINILDCEPEVTVPAVSTQRRTTMNGNSVKYIIAGLEKLGYEVNGLELRTISDGRVRVVVNGKVIGIWDEARKTFVD